MPDDDFIGLNFDNTTNAKEVSIVTDDSLYNLYACVVTRIQLV